MSNKYSISFVIPTRNRSEFIVPLIIRCLEIPGSKIIISDNSDSNSLGDTIKSFNNERITYNYYSDRLSVIDNFNISLESVDTTFVCFLGDDDILGPGFQDAIDIMINKEIDVLNFDYGKKPLQYFWPNNPSKRWGDLGGKIFFNSFSGNLKLIELNYNIQSVKNKIGLGPLSMPRLYLGVVRMSLINKIIDKYGCIFGGYSPDIFSSYLLSLESSKAYSIDYPIIIPGACSKSTSSARANRSDIGDLVNNDHLGRFRDFKWDERVPAFYSPFNVWASTLLKAMEVNDGKISSYDFCHLYAVNLMNSPKNILKILLAIKKLSGSNFFARYILYCLTFMRFLILFFEKIVSAFKYIFYSRPGGVEFEIDNNKTSYDAFLSLKNHLNSSKVEIKNKIK